MKAEWSCLVDSKKVCALKLEDFHGQEVHMEMNRMIGLNSITTKHIS